MTPAAMTTDSSARMLRSLLVALGLFAVALGAVTPAWAQQPPRILKGPYLQNLGPSSVEIRAEVDVALPAIVTVTPKTPVGPDAGAPQTVRDQAASTMHVVRVSGLSPGTRYVYSFKVGDTTATGELTTAPPPSSSEPFSFLVYGDNRTDDVAHATVVRAMLQTPSDFIVNTGDYVQDGSSSEDWQSFFDVERLLLRDRCMFGCVGNHEITDGAGANYLRYLGPVSDAHGVGDKPRLYGSFRWGTTRFFLLDAMESFADGPERTWLEDELARADAESDVKWRIVVLHHSPWSAGPHGGNRRVISAGIPALFAQHHVDLLLAGHDHIYERGLAAGIPYVVSGGGGAPLYPIDHPIASTRKAESVHHFIEAVVSADAIRIVAKRDDGSLLDRCGLLKAPIAWDCDAVPPATSSAAPAIPTPPPSVPSKCACDTVGRRPSEVAAGLHGLAGLALAALAWLRRRNRG
jgi:hypothetical protein